MTTATTTNASAQPTGMVAMLTLLISTGLPIAAILTAGVRDVDVEPGLIDWIFVAAVAVVTLVTFALLVPWAARRPDPAKIGLGLSVTAILLTPVLFWTMLPVIFGSAGAWLARQMRLDSTRSSSPGMTMTAMVLGLLAAAASIAGYILTS